MTVRKAILAFLLPCVAFAAAGFNLMIAFLFGCFSPTVLGWTKANYSMSTGLASLAVAYLVGAILIAFAGRTHLWFQRAWKSTR